MARKRVAKARHGSFMVYRKAVLSALLIASFPALPGERVFAQNASAIEWQSPAEFHQVLKSKTRGTLLFDSTGIEFKSEKLSHRWVYEEVKTFHLSGARELVITDYENRHWHEPGERRFRFTLRQPMPPGIAAGLTAHVERPVIDGDPFPDLTVMASLPAHRRERFGGSNGELRFRDQGIDYVAADGRDGRSWRWSDIQTLANPNPWEFRIMAYREIVEFDLKRPLSRDLFNKLWDILYAEDLNVTPPRGAQREDNQ
jgi:hypothetical protein